MTRSGTIAGMSPLRTPVVLVVFNRPAETARVLEVISRAKPPKLLVIADGPRKNREGEAERCAATRALLDRVDWDCEILRCFSDVNLGCRERLYTGLSWAFDQVEEAIILEDDVLPDPTFFPYCEELLAKYRSNDEVMSISGGCFLPPADRPSTSYYFSDFPLVWGWASWRRAWKKNDGETKGWPEYRESAEFRKKAPSLIPRRHLRSQMDRVHARTLDTWDYPWTFSIWKAGGRVILPSRNLVKNIGFGADATHTLHYDPEFDPAVSPMPFPLVHPRWEDGKRTDLDMIWMNRHNHPVAKIRRRVNALLRRVRG
jgi:GT2 family glycosyltransferase